MALPPRVWARIVVLFCALAFIKIALLLSLGRHAGAGGFRGSPPERILAAQERSERGADLPGVLL
jgi:hypothetical protein